MAVSSVSILSFLFLYASTGVIKLKNNGDFFIANEGRRPIYIDGRPVLCGSKWRLSNNSVVEVSQGWRRGLTWCLTDWSMDVALSLLYRLSLLSLLLRSPACDSSSSSTRTSLPSSGLRLPRSHHSEAGSRNQGILWPQFPLSLQLP